MQVFLTNYLVFQHFWVTYMVRKQKRGNSLVWKKKKWFLVNICPIMAFFDPQWLFLLLIGSELCSIKKFSVETFMGAHFGAIHRPWEADNTPITVLKNLNFGGQFLPCFQDSSVEFLRAGTKLAKFFADSWILTISSRTKIIAKMWRFWAPWPKMAKSQRNQKIPLSGENFAIILHLFTLQYISKPIFMPEKNYANFGKIAKNHTKMGPRATVLAPNSKKCSVASWFG